MYDNHSGMYRVRENRMYTAQRLLSISPSSSRFGGGARVASGPSRRGYLLAMTGYVRFLVRSSQLNPHNSGCNDIKSNIVLAGGYWIEQSFDETFGPRRGL